MNPDTTPRQFTKPPCWSAFPPAQHGANVELAPCSVWASRREMLAYCPGCDGCQRNPYAGGTHDQG